MTMLLLSGSVIVSLLVVIVSVGVDSVVIVGLVSIADMWEITAALDIKHIVLVLDAVLILSIVNDN